MASYAVLLAVLVSTHIEGCSLGQLIQFESYARGSELRREIKRRGNIKHVVCHKGSRMCFMLTENKTLLIISSGVFLLEPLEVPGDLWRRRLNKIRRLILERKIRDYNELIGHCRPGITMMNVKLEWYI